MRGSLLVASVAAAAALVACYDPQVADCQFVCGSNNACPEGTTCMAGFCRNPGATGTCTSAQLCPKAPCGAASVAVTGECLALCTQQVVFDGALSTCGSDDGGTGWHLAIEDTPARRAEAAAQFSHMQGWVGLARPTSLVVYRWLTPNGAAVQDSAGEWESTPSTEDLAAALDTDKQQLVPLRADQQKPYFCAMRTQ